jgi:hypothetical protein
VAKPACAAFDDQDAVPAAADKCFGDGGTPCSREVQDPEAGLRGIKSEPGGVDKLAKATS